MSSVQGYSKCPKCEGVCFTNFNCKTQEDYVFCQRCGYVYSHKLKRTRKGKVITRKNGYPFYKDKVKGGYGVMSLVTKDGIARNYGLNFWTALWARNTFQRFLQTDTADPAESYLYVWDWKTRSHKSIHGKKLPSYDEAIPEIYE